MAQVIIRDETGAVLWLRDGDSWRLPGGAAGMMEPPWETAVRHTRAQIQQPIQLTNLTGVYLEKERPSITFVFTGTARGRVGGETAVYFPPGTEPANAPPQPIAHITDAINPGEETVFRFHKSE